MSTILPVAQQGEAILSLVAADVSEQELGSPWLEQLLASMQSTMLHRQGVGIAAPQVYVSKRVIIVASRPNLRYPDAPLMEPIYMINPTIIAASAEQVLGEEGCLSVPEQRGDVARAEQIELSYLNIAGERMQMHLSGFPARIVQHEIDHLNGRLFVDYLDDVHSINL